MRPRGRGWLLKVEVLRLTVCVMSVTIIDRTQDWSTSDSYRGSDVDMYWNCSINTTIVLLWRERERDQLRYLKKNSASLLC